MAKRNASRYCCFKGCKNTSDLEGIHFYRFPKEEKRCEAWVKASQNEKLIGVPASQLYARAHLCSDHFHDWCFMNAVSKHRLVHNAIPNSEKKLAAPSPVSQNCSNFEVSEISSANHSALRDLLISPTAPSPVSHNSSNFEVSEISSANHSALRDLLISPIATKQVCDVTKSQCTINSVSSNATSVSGNDTIEICDSPAATAICITPKSRPLKRKYTPRKKMLAKKIKMYRDTLRQLKSKYAIMRQRNRSPRLSLKTALSNQGVSSKLSTFIQRQVVLNTTKKNGRRFTENDKIQAYRIFSKSKAAYRVLRETIELPAEKTLHRFVASKLSFTGIDEDIISALKRVLKDKAEKEKLFALIFDEVSLKPCLVYDTKLDAVVGFEDFSGGIRTNSIANHGLVLMLRSLTGKEKLPLGFFFSCYAINAEKLQEIIMRALRELNDAGAVIKVLICDQGGNNSRLYKMLGVVPDKPFFTFNDRKVYCMFDPPHLLKNLRRNLMKYNLQTNEGMVSFLHIKDFYDADKKLPIRCAPKLTDAHITAAGLNSMKVSLAAQIFSHTVAAGMNMSIMCNLIQAEAAATVNFLLKINNLFDSMNGTSKKPLKGNDYHCAAKKDSVHLPFWKKILPFIESWDFVPQHMKKASDSNIVANKSSEKKKATPGPRNKQGWLLTVSALLHLSEEMLMDWDYFMTKRCNQDCIENFFSRIRGCGGNRTNPSAYEFSSAFKICSINTFWSNNKFSNCEPDGDKFMHLLLSSSADDSKNDTTLNENQLDIEMEDAEAPAIAIECFYVADEDEPSFENSDIIAQNIISYLSGYLSRRVINFLKLRECAVCQSQLTDKSKSMLQHTMYLHFKEYKDNNIEGGLIHPSADMINCINVFYRSAELHFKEHLAENHLLKNLKLILSESQMLQFLNCELHSSSVKEKIVHFSALLFLKIHLREKNREISTSKFDLKQLRVLTKKTCP